MPLEIQPFGRGYLTRLASFLTLIIGSTLDPGHAVAQSVTARVSTLDADAATGPRAGFRFELTAASTTSAGVYRDGVLLKTLWNNRRLPAGSHAAHWDGTTDEDTVAPTGRYSLTVLANDVQHTWGGVIGNTSESFTGPTKHHAEDIALGMAVSGSHIYIATGYNEARASTFKVSTANPQAKTTVMPTRFRYTGAVTFFVAADDTTVYWAGMDPFEQSKWFVFGSRVSDDTEVVFSEGKPIALGRDGSGVKYQSAIGYNNAKGLDITGLAVQRTGRYLFVARGLLGRIDVLDKSSGALVRSVSVATPERLATDATGAVWVTVLQDGQPVVRKFEAGEDGSLNPVTGLSITDVAQPLGLAVSPDGATVLIADGGTSQQVKAFDARTGQRSWVLGRPGGYVDGPAVTDDKFMFHNFTQITFHQGRDWSFVAFQPDGSFWVGDSGNNRSQHYRSDRIHLRRLMWMPLFYSVTADPNDPKRVFGNLLEFDVDYTRPLAPDNGSWKLVRNWGYAFPGKFKDKYGSFLNVATLSNGRTYAQFREAAAGVFELAELVNEKGLRFTGIRTPVMAQSLHPDGSMRTTALQGPNRPIEWRKQDLLGFDTSGNPQWGPMRRIASLGTYARTDPIPYFNVLPYAWEQTTSGALVIFNARFPRDAYKNDPVSHDGWHLGGLDAGTGQWRWKAAPSTTRNYHGDWPSDGAFDIGNHVVNAGTKSHVVGSSIFWQHCGENWKGGRSGEVNMWTHMHENGLMIGLFGALQQTVRYQEVEGQPGMAGNASASRIVRGPKGELYIYHNDESFHGGIHRWRVENLASIGERSVVLEWEASRYRKLTDPADLLEGVPRSTNLRDGDGGWRRAPEQDIAKDHVYDWFHVLTSVKNYRKDVSADIEFRHVGVPSAKVWRELPGVTVASNGWRLASVLAWSWENHGEIDQKGSGGIYVEILDAQERVIARVWPKMVRHPNDYRLLANGSALASAQDQATFQELIEAPLPLEITADDGRLTFAYGNHPPVMANILDPTSDWREPKFFAIQGWSNAGSAHRRTVNLTKLRFSATPP